MDHANDDDSIPQRLLMLISIDDEPILLECAHCIVGSLQICDTQFIFDGIIPSISKLLSKTAPVSVTQLMISLFPSIADILYDRFPDLADDLVINFFLLIIRIIVLNGRKNINDDPLLICNLNKSSNSQSTIEIDDKVCQTYSLAEICSNIAPLSPSFIDVIPESWASLISLLDPDVFLEKELPFLFLASTAPKKESRIILLKLISYLIHLIDIEILFSPSCQIIYRLASDISGTVRCLVPVLIAQMAQKLPNRNLNSPTLQKIESSNSTFSENDGKIEQSTQNEKNAKSLSFELARLSARFVIFSRDSNLQVRRATAESVVILCESLDSSSKRVTILPLVDQLLNDPSEIVRCAMNRNLGPLILSLGSKLCSKALVSKYCVSLSSNDVNESYVAAFSLPAVCIALGKERFSELRGSLNIAVNSKEFRIRRTLSFGLLSFAYILTENELFELAMNFLLDIPPVAIGVMSNLNVIASMISCKLRPKLLFCLVDPATKYHMWRMRLKVSEQLRYCADLFNSNENQSPEIDSNELFINKEIELSDSIEKSIPHSSRNEISNQQDCFQLLKHSAMELMRDPVAIVRKDAVLSFAYLMKANDKDDCNFVVTLSKSEKFYEREIAASVFEYADFDKISSIIDVLLNDLLKDNVANIRINVANAIRTIYANMNTNEPLYQRIIECVHILHDDIDPDVKSAIQAINC